MLITGSGEVIKPANRLAIIVESSGLDQNKSKYILEKFSDFFQVAATWEAKAKMLTVTSENQVAEMKMAREGRLFLKSKRVDIEKGRKELKEQCIREGKAIEGIANVLKALIVPLEEYLEQQERFVEIKEEHAREIRAQTRISEFEKLGIDPNGTLYSRDLIKNMTEEGYQAIITAHKLSVQREIEANKKAEEDRIAKEKEQARIKTENERLKAEAKEKERLIAEERAKVKAEKEAQERKIAREKEIALKKAQQERKILEEKLAKDKAEADRKLKEARAERERLEAELKARKDAEEAEKLRIEQAMEVIGKATDNEKLLKLADEIAILPLPQLRGDYGNRIVEHVYEMLAEITLYIRVQIQEKA